MGIHGIIGDAPVFFYKVQAGFACLEEDLYIPAFPINADDFFPGVIDDTLSGDVMVELIHSARCAGITARYVLFDSWFVLTITSQSFRLLLLRTYTNFAGMLSPSFSTVTDTESCFS